MVTIEFVREFLGWCALLNLGMLTFASIVIMLFRARIIRIHQQFIELDERDLNRAYFQYLAQYKIATIVLCVIPYLAVLLTTR